MVFSPKLKENILVTGRSSRFCQFLKKDLKKFNAIFTTKKTSICLILNKWKNLLKIKKLNI